MTKINVSLEKYPEFLSSEHLVQLGIYKSTDAAYQARVHGHSPQYIKMKHKILYPRQAVIDFLASRIFLDIDETLIALEKDDVAGCHKGCLS